MADSSKVEVGDIVLAVGDPFGIGQTVTQGIVSATGRSGLGIEQLEDFIQTDAAINPGNSGGALVDEEGHLVGINTAIVGNSGGNVGIGFAVPINLAKHDMDSILAHGKVDRGYIGVHIERRDSGAGQGFPRERGRRADRRRDSGPGPAASAGSEERRHRHGAERPADRRERTSCKTRIGTMDPGTKVNMKVIARRACDGCGRDAGELPG